MEDSNNLAVVENLMIAVRFSNRTTVEVIEAEAKVDLAEFDLTPQEVQKLGTILRRLNDELAESLQKRCSAVSIISALQPTEHN
jgi:hypothetical protein